MKLNPQAFGWQDRAACKGAPLGLFFGPENERGDAKKTRESAAKAICAQCPVRSECLEYALSLPERYGVYGGLNEDERRSEQRRRARARRGAA